jgi:3-methyladenine DNA glycosylase AlkD
VKRAAATSTKKKAALRRAAPDASIDERVRCALDALKRKSTKATRDGMARYALPSDRAFGVSMKDVQAIAKTLGRDHALAAALWNTGWYEASMLCAYVDEPARVTPAQMDRWCRDFDNWAICDTLCFSLFDRTPHAWRKVASWSKKRGEFEKRAAFALLASLALHDKQSASEPFIECLPLIEKAASDDRNFVKKSVSWALRAIGGRKAPELKAAAIEIARKLAQSSDASARWIGKDALRQLAARS